jgi:hypothetical protein
MKHISANHSFIVFFIFDINPEVCNLTLARLPGASEYHDGQVNVLSCLPDGASCLATKARHL